MDFSLLESYLSDGIAYLLPFAETGILAAACVVAASRLPLLSIAALAVACCCLGASLSTGAGGREAGMQMVAAALAAAAILLLSGGKLWRRPSLRAILHRASPKVSTAEGETSRCGGLAEGLLFRISAVAVIALAVEALAPLLPLPVAAEEKRLAAWLAGMGLFAGLSCGSAIIAGTGMIMALSAAALLIPDLVPEITVRPTAYAVVPVLMVVAALGFSFADTIKRREPAPANELQAHEQESAGESG